MKEMLKITKKRPKGEDGHKTFSIRITDETTERRNEIAVKTGRTRNELIGILLNFALDNCEIDEKY